MEGAVRAALGVRRAPGEEGLTHGCHEPGTAAGQSRHCAVRNAISLGGVLVCFAALAPAAIAFVYWFLPETKGLPVEDIVRLFERHHETATPITYSPTVKG